MKMHIGENIKRLRKEKDLTQETLAEALGVSCASVSKWERQETFPDITLLQPLAYFFGVSVDDLLGYDREKIQKEIDGVLAHYVELYREFDPVTRTHPKAQEAESYIRSAYEKYPGDYRIMSAYMWHIGGNYADNDPLVLVEHADEFREICRRILEGCPDFRLRQDALNMEAKLLWAEGKPDKAVELYRNHFGNWYETAEQKTEQLFPKDSPEFMQQVRRNMIELSSFAADKLCKTVYFDTSIPLEDRIQKAEEYGKRLSELAEETGEPCFAAFAASFWGRLENDVYYRGGGEQAEQHAKEEYQKSVSLCKKLAEKDAILTEVMGWSWKK